MDLVQGIILGLNVSLTGPHLHLYQLIYTMGMVIKTRYSQGWGGGHISAASRGSGGMLPQKIFCILRWTLT